MMPVSVMAHEVELAVRETVDGLVRAKRVNGSFFVNLPILYPDGSFVTVKIDQVVGGLRVSDHGFAYREAEDVGAGRSFKRIANKYSEESAVCIGDRMIFRDVPIDQLHAAICEVAEISWKVADDICVRAFDEDEKALSNELNERLIKVFGAANVKEETNILGASTTPWSVSSVVRTNGHEAVFQAVSQHANSIYKASTAFRDLAALERPPRLVAVVRSKASLGNKLALLAPGRVVEQAQEDASFIKAAA
jgi:hypothetical protein